MIAIRFSPIYEDRVSIYLKSSNIKIYGITYDFTDTPGIENDRNCYWLFKYQHAKHVNLLLSLLKEMKSVMGIDDLEFSYCYNEKEFYLQYSEEYLISWFKV